MTADEFIAARNAYSYIPARLIKSTNSEPADLIWGDLKLVRELPSNWDDDPLVRLQYSSVDLDEYHGKLLNADADEALLHGLASTMFWGHASAGIERALAKSRELASGRDGPRRVEPQTPHEIVKHIRAASKRLKAGDTGAALIEARRITFLGMSFASKVVTFMNPSKAAVYDSRIRTFLSDCTCDRLRAMAVPANANGQSQAHAYARWCAYCSEKALALNQARHKWKDWSGKQYAWRTVDIERACFTLANSGSRHGG